MLNEGGGAEPLDDLGRAWRRYDMAVANAEEPHAPDAAGVELAAARVQLVDLLRRDGWTPDGVVDNQIARDRLRLLRGRLE